MLIHAFIWKKCKGYSIHSLTWRWNLMIRNPKAIDEAVEQLKKTGWCWEYQRVLWDLIIKRKKESMARTDLSNQKLGEESWQACYEGLKLQVARYTIFFECKSYWWYWKNSVEGQNVWNQDSSLSCEILKNYYCQCNSRVIQGHKQCKPCWIPWDTLSN